VAKTNKPIFSVAPGHAFNSGAALLASSAFPVVTFDTLMSFNDVTFGFIPHGGSTYHLSRLPNELGTFLALTGLPISGADVKEFSLAEGFAHIPKNYELIIANRFAMMDIPVPTAELLTNRFKNIPYYDYLKEKK